MGWGVGWGGEHACVGVCVCGESVHAVFMCVRVQAVCVCVHVWCVVCVCVVLCVM